MATQNSINVSEGTTGQLLVAVTNSAPAFGASANADFSFITSTPGATRTLTVSNLDNTNAASNALLALTTGGSSAGDPSVTFSTTATQWSMGIDNSDSGSFVVSQNSTLGTNNVIHITTGGQINYPLQSSFLAVLNNNLSNLTGDTTAYTIVWDTVVYNVNSNFDGISTYTAPVTGKYRFMGAITFSNIGLQSTSSVKVVTTARTYQSGNLSLNIVKDVNNNCSLIVSCLADMSAGDTATLVAVAGGSSKTVGLIGSGSTTPSCYFSGTLVA